MIQYAAVFLQRIFNDYLFEHPIYFTGYLLLVLVVIYALITEYQRYKACIPGLGGPRGYPIVGNIPQIRKNAAEQYRLWRKQFGPVYQIMLGNVPVVVVNSAAAAKQIFTTNSQALSSRPEFYTFHKVVSSTAGTTIGTSPFSDSLKRRRKGAASALNRPSVVSYIPHIDIESRDFIDEFLELGKAGQKPVDPLPMIQRLSLSLALTLNWGVRMASQNDELFDEITQVEQAASSFRSTTGNLQDYIPILRLMPFNNSRARETRSRRDVYLQRLNDDLDRRIKEGNYKPCIQANVILDKDTKLTHEELLSISLTMLNAGLDTLGTLMQWSMLLLAMRPDIQEKALAEIRKVYPGDATGILCDASDDQSIPYIVALIRELLRYYSVLRLNLPRATIQDINYNGVIIPAGSVIFLNAWSCNMDPDVWGDDYLVFRPERWLEKPEAPFFSYGIGYRMCTGSVLANREMYTIFLRLMSAFEIKNAVYVDPEGADQVDPHPVTGIEDPTHLVSAPKRYKVTIAPRDEIALRKALSKAKIHDKD
ncbi:hypothetical protein LTR10_022459 [Elasticomyces elasticus]|uniref:3-hydroxyphenylacetate 6-hydroxylase n=1 Tax=Exophiala sideris TaxID=1016849 RepID=A0ABR0J2K1_9EURO|nr:hypothetical protein LTR10_022459 [Elasticomyces elasticus]KAK5024895.1 hypothetical protein LTS07_008273 [Exophiala sideris]KAK5031515.1 hypothetical protein LTR13_007843 [Exophiala sideris]KAK5054934.1 hypothetical protein LTR69_008502 [Exophiala sideris]KAK5179813.1 hypothetical protein LTR44_007629 [Eurotiomycetes sp. CCFEE 6388]